MEHVWNEKGNNFPVCATDPDALTTREAFSVPDLVLHELCSSFGMLVCYSVLTGNRINISLG